MLNCVETGAKGHGRQFAGLPLLSSMNKLNHTKSTAFSIL